MALVTIGRDSISGPLFASNGLGLQVPDTFGSARGMGGAGIADVGGRSFMRGNPALYSAIEKHTYTFGATFERNDADTGVIAVPSYSKTRADIFSLVIPLWKGVVMGWSLTPLTRTDSTIEYQSSDYKDTVTFTGGVNMSSLALAGTIREVIRVGVSFDYSFGMIEERWVRKFYSTSDDYELYNSYDYIKRKYKGYGTTFGIIAKVYKDTHVGIGYSSEMTMDKTVRVIPGYYANPEKTYDTGESMLPETWRFGVSSMFWSRLVANLDVTLAGWKNAAKNDIEKEMYDDTVTVCGGFRLEPQRAVGLSLIEKYPLSIGFKVGNLYYKSYPKIDTISEKAVTFGIELPFKEDLARMETSFEFGLRGDKEKNGWEENYTSIGFVLIGTIK